MAHLATQLATSRARAHDSHIRRPCNIAPFMLNPRFQVNRPSVQEPQMGRARRDFDRIRRNASLCRKRPVPEAPCSSVSGASSARPFCPNISNYAIVAVHASAFSLFAMKRLWKTMDVGLPDLGWCDIHGVARPNRISGMKLDRDIGVS